MGNKYFAELARRLREDGISTGESASGCLTILLHGRAVIIVGKDSDVFLTPEGSGNQEASELYHPIKILAAVVKEYTSAIERAPLLQARALDEPFRLLADFNGVVLAAYEMERNRGYKFATWDWDYDRKGVNQGDYFINDYEAAKKSFAIRTGLLQKERQFTDTQLAALYLTSAYFLEEGFELKGPEQMEALTSARKQIEDAVLDLQELLGQRQVQDPVFDM